MTSPHSGAKVVRYSPNWQSNFADDAATARYQSADMELDNGDTTSQIYMPPFTLFPPELVDDFTIDWYVHFSMQAAVASDTHGVTFWIRKLDTHYPYPVDVSSTSQPIAGTKHVDMVPVTFTIPSVTTLTASNNAELAFTLHVRALVHTQAPWSLTTGTPNTYGRIYNPADLSQADGALQKMYVQYRLTAGRSIRPSVSNTTNISVLAQEQVINHTFSSRVVSGARQDLFPNDGGSGVNLWLMAQKTTANGAMGMSSGIIYSTPLVLRPGMVAAQSAVPFLTGSEVLL